MKRIIIAICTFAIGHQTTSAQTAPSSCSPTEVYQCTAVFQYDIAGNRTAGYQICACQGTASRVAGRRVAEAAKSSITTVVDGAGSVAIAQIYPNPTQANVTVVLTEPSIGMLTISDATGRVMGQEAFNGQEVLLSLSAYPAGLYIINLGTSATAHKIVKID